MEKNSQTQNTIQDTFLNQVRKERSPVTIYLMSGVKLTGKIRSFDKYSLILEAGAQEQLIFKHAISTVSVMRVGGGGRDSHHSHSDRDHTEHAPHVEPKGATERP
ncbi:MAG: RNA chaperone Hfq [Acidobacteria bacterium]|nr:RNA chaperone Hfq [Acidobacteriota bacterium]